MEASKGRASKTRKRGFSMFNQSLSMTERVFNAIAFVAIVCAGVCLALAYFDVLTK
jgi:hypothetical protein